jgi:predicted  nucleic acid-binding Zn-ribbon protein
VKAGTQSALQQLREEIKLAERNLAFASNQESFKSIGGVIAELKERENALATEMQAAELRSNDGSDPDQQIEAALAFADRLSELASDGDNFALAQIQARPKKRRTVNQICGGVVTLGTAASPIDLYSGPDKSQ